MVGAHKSVNFAGLLACNVSYAKRKINYTGVCCFERKGRNDAQYTNHLERHCLKMDINTAL